MALLAALSAAFPAFGYESGNELLSALQSKDPNVEFGATQWIMGYLSNQLEHNDYKCRDGITKGQVIDVVRLYLERNPSFRDHPPGMQVYLALFMAEVCMYDKEYGRQRIEKLEQHLRQRK
jgi:hypothetical protein